MLGHEMPYVQIGPFKFQNFKNSKLSFEKLNDNEDNEHDDHEIRIFYLLAYIIKKQIVLVRKKQ